MNRWKPAAGSRAHRQQPSPWRLQATELVREILATARALAAAADRDGTSVWPPDAVWDLLAIVEDGAGARSISDLAGSLRISRQSAHELVTRAARAGFVELHTHPRDRRIVTVEVSPEGASALRELRGRQATWVIEMLYGIEMREMQPMLRVLGIIRYRLQRAERWRAQSRPRARPRLRPR